VSLEPHSIEGILNTISTVGAFAEAEDEAVGLVELLRERLGAIENRVLERRGHPTHEIERYRQFVGSGVPTLCRRALGAAGGDSSSESLDDVIAELRSIYSEHQYDATTPYDGIREVLADLAGRGVELAVLSNKPHPNTVQVVEHYFGSGTFRVILGHVAGSPPKPDPAGALAILREFDVQPTQAAMVGDSDVDMQTAHAAGLAAIGCRWGFRGEAELLAAGAVAVAANPHDLARIL
jgi:phosphoglycolate phosphatase